jgi:uncharacterized protein DUF1360
MAPAGGGAVVRAAFGTRFLVGSLAVWRLTHLIAEEDGPGDLVLRIRERLGSSRLGDLMDCFACVSVWVAAPVSLSVAERTRDVPIVWLALSGSACLLERVAALPEARAPA